MLAIERAQILERLSTNAAHAETSARVRCRAFSVGDDDDVDLDDAFLDSEDPQTNEDVIENIQPDVTEESTNPDAKVHLPKPEERSELADVDYNPEDDIIETRKRWIYPRPHRPYIKY